MSQYFVFKKHKNKWYIFMSYVTNCYFYGIILIFLNIMFTNTESLIFLWAKFAESIDSWPNTVLV